MQTRGISYPFLGVSRLQRVNKLFGLVPEILVFIAMLHMPKSSLKAHTDIFPAGLEV